MKKNIILILFLFACIFVMAQNTDEKKYLLTTHTTTFGLSTLSFLDPYLSPLTYSGFGMRYEHESRRFLSPENIKVSMQSNLNIETGIALNPPVTSSMAYLGANYSWGMHYHFRPVKGLHILVGGLWDVDFGVKEVPRNINNPVNIDMATNLSISGIAMYDVPLHKRTLRLQLSLQTPVLGCMFVPGGGASYYEIFSLGNLTDAFHFSSLHNKRGLHSTFTVDVPFNRSVWRFGLNMQGLKYMANDMVFEKNEFSLLIGTTFDVATFTGRKNKAPKNFISTND